jgi:hypothetical protein
MKINDIKIVIATRFNCDIYNKTNITVRTNTFDRKVGDVSIDDYIEAKLYALANVGHQTLVQQTDQDFLRIIVCDSRTPKNIIDRLKAIVATSSDKFQTKIVMDLHNNWHTSSAIDDLVMNFVDDGDFLVYGSLDIDDGIGITTIADIKEYVLKNQRDDEYAISLNTIYRYNILEDGDENMSVERNIKRTTPFFYIVYGFNRKDVKSSTAFSHVKLDDTFPIERVDGVGLATINSNNIHNFYNKYIERPIDDYKTVLFDLFGISGVIKRIPSVFILSAPKTSTTSLYFALNTHPCIDNDINTPKEPNYFSNDFDEDLSYYENLYSVGMSHHMLIDASTSYFTDHSTYQKIASVVDHPKIITILRNPVDRLISEFIHFKAIWNVYNVGDMIRKAIESPPYPEFMEHLEAGDGWGGESRSLSELIDNRKCDRDRNTYFYGGEYITHLKDMYAVFPQEDIHIVLFDDLVSNSNNEISKIEKFIGISNVDLKFPYINTQSVWMNFVDVDSEVHVEDIKYIRDYYIYYNDILSKYLGRELDWNYKSKWYEYYGLNFGE